MAAGYPWITAHTEDPEDPDTAYWRERAMRAEREARHNRDLAEFTRDMGLAILRAAPTEGDET